MKKAIFLALTLFSLCIVNAQRNQLLMTGNLKGNNAQISFEAFSSADISPDVSDFKIPTVNVVISGLSTSLFHNASAFPMKLDDCSERVLREQSPADAPFFERQTLSLSFSPSLSSDRDGNFIFDGEAKASYNLLNALYPIPVRRCERSEDCDEIPSRTTYVAIRIKLSSANGVFNELRRVIDSQSENSTIRTLSWDVEYSIQSRISDNESSRGFKNFKLSNGRLKYPIDISAVVVPTDLPNFRIWKSLKLQPIGIQTSPRLICIGPLTCSCCQTLWLIDLTPTGTKGLNFGRPAADAQWRKAGITFDWLPIIYLTDGTLKSLTPAEESVLYNSYSDSTAVEIFFARQFEPYSSYGGGFTVSSGTANAKIVTTEYMIDDCNKDFTHLAHELGHVLNLPHPSSSSTSSTNTLMCPSGYCNDNPARNSLGNQQNANNPLITFYLSTAFQSADDCNYSADCGACPII